MYSNGARARELGYSLEDNPYWLNTPHHKSWAEGWCDQDVIEKQEPNSLALNKTFLAQMLGHVFRTGELAAAYTLTGTVIDGSLETLDELLTKNTEEREQCVLDMLALAKKRGL